MAGFEEFINNMSKPRTPTTSRMDVGGMIESFLAGKTGSGLTNAQIEQNAFQERMSNTAYQRGVQDMKYAGLNPALMYGSGASGASSPSGASATVGSLDLQGIIQALMLPKQLQQMKAAIDVAKAEKGVKESEISKNAAETALKEKQGRQMDFDYQFLQDVRDFRMKGERNAADISEGQVKTIYRNLDKMDKEIELLVKQGKTEDERAILTHLQGVLADAQAQQIVELLPYEKAFKAAATQAQRAAAAASMANAMYQNGLIEAGYIDKMVEQAAAAAHLSKENAIAQEYKNAMQSGHLSDFLDKYSQDNDISFADGIISAFSAVTNCIGNVFGGIVR